jgi:hypothetical protein
VRKYGFLLKNFKPEVLSTPKQHHLIGPPDKYSNIRPIKFHIPKNESKRELQLRRLVEFVQDWNQEYWTQQNLKYVTEKQKFVENWKLWNNYDQIRTNDPNIDSKLVCEFNKNFLNDTFVTHWNYNKIWYSYNFQLLWLEFRVFTDRLFKNLGIKKA